MFDRQLNLTLEDEVLMICNASKGRHKKSWGFSCEPSNSTVGVFDSWNVALINEVDSIENSRQLLSSIEKHYDIILNYRRSSQRTKALLHGHDYTYIYLTILLLHCGCSLGEEQEKNLSSWKSKWWKKSGHEMIIKKTGGKFCGLQ